MYTEPIRVSVLRLHSWMLLCGLSTLCPCDTCRRNLCSHCLPSPEIVEREKSYKTGLRVDWNLSGRGICRAGSLPSREETARTTGLLLPILAFAATATIKGTGDEEFHHARPSSLPGHRKGWWSAFSCREGHPCHAKRQDFPHRPCHIAWVERDLSDQIKSSAINHRMEKSQHHVKEVSSWAKKKTDVLQDN